MSLFELTGTRSMKFSIKFSRLLPAHLRCVLLILPAMIVVRNRRLLRYRVRWHHQDTGFINVAGLGGIIPSSPTPSILLLDTSYTSMKGGIGWNYGERERFRFWKVFHFYFGSAGKRRIGRKQESKGWMIPGRVESGDFGPRMFNVGFESGVAKNGITKGQTPSQEHVPFPG